MLKTNSTIKLQKTTVVLEINIKKGQGDKEINLLKESEIEKTANSEQMKKGQQKVQKKCQ